MDASFGRGLNARGRTLKLETFLPKSNDCEEVDLYNHLRNNCENIEFVSSKKIRELGEVDSWPPPPNSTKFVSTSWAFVVEDGNVGKLFLDMSNPAHLSARVRGQRITFWWCFHLNENSVLPRLIAAVKRQRPGSQNVFGEHLIFHCLAANMAPALQHILWTVKDDKWRTIGGSIDGSRNEECWEGLGLHTPTTDLEDTLTKTDCGILSLFVFRNSFEEVFETPTPCELKRLHQMAKGIFSLEEESHENVEILLQNDTALNVLKHAQAELLDRMGHVFFRRCLEKAETREMANRFVLSVSYAGMPFLKIFEYTPGFSFPEISKFPYYAEEAERVIAIKTNFLRSVAKLPHSERRNFGLAAFCDSRLSLEGFSDMPRLKALSVILNHVHPFSSMKDHDEDSSFDAEALEHYQAYWDYYSQYDKGRGVPKGPEDGFCVICHSDKVQCAFVPCHHMALCHRCRAADTRQPFYCPLCFAPVRDVVFVRK